MKIGFMGLGKLGLSCALAIESRGHEVAGYDYDPKIKKYITEGKIPYKEKDVEKAKKKSEIANDIVQVFRETNKEKRASRLNVVIGRINGVR